MSFSIYFTFSSVCLSLSIDIYVYIYMYRQRHLCGGITFFWCQPSSNESITFRSFMLCPTHQNQQSVIPLSEKLKRRRKAKSPLNSFVIFLQFSQYLRNSSKIRKKNSSESFRTKNHTAENKGFYFWISSEFVRIRPILENGEK